MTPTHWLGPIFVALCCIACGVLGIVAILAHVVWGLAR